MFKQIKTTKTQRENTAGGPNWYTVQHRTLYSKNKKYNFNLTSEEIKELESIALDYGLSGKLIATIMYKRSQKEDYLKNLDNFTALKYLFIGYGKD